MKSGVVAFGVFLILLMVGIKYIFLPMLVQQITNEVSQYVGSSLASNLVTVENIQRFCTAINSDVGIFGISIQDIAGMISPDTVNKCNQFQVIMQVVSLEYVFYIVGIIIVFAGIVLGGNKEAHVNRKSQESEREKDEPSRRGKKFCPECGESVNPKNKFCGKCGEKL